MSLKLIEIYNKSYKPRLFVASDEQEALKLAGLVGHLRKGLPRRVEDRTDDFAKDYQKPEKIQEYIAAGTPGALSFERTNQSWVFKTS